MQPNNENCIEYKASVRTRRSFFSEDALYFVIQLKHNSTKIQAGNIYVHGPNKFLSTKSCVYKNSENEKKSCKSKYMYIAFMLELTKST